ncbi:MAG: NCS2 family permease [Kiritimatiellae bacterium]|nr:NCS2 family permease [Kiritimatiellia bacterium]
MLEKLFKLSANKTTVKTELVAGLTTFMTMAYILAVNPGILSNAPGLEKGGVFVATALAAFIGTACMAFFANYPFALAPGLGLNAFFAFTVCLTMGYSWQFALLAVFVEGLVFLALSLTPVRESIFNAIPFTLKKAVAVGIGLFITFIALQGAKVVVDNPATLVGVTNFHTADFHTAGIWAILALVGTVITGVMVVKKWKAAILLGILITWGLGMIAEATGLYVPDFERGFFPIIPHFGSYFKDLGSDFSSFKGICGALFDSSAWTHGTGDAQRSGWVLVRSLDFFVVMFAFFFVDLFDTLGTLIGVSMKGGFLDKDGKLPRISGALYADSIATSVGAVLGTSTTTTYVESASGVAAGGKTGLTAMTTALLFLAALILSPVFTAIPGFATAPALMIVGFYMITAIAEIDFNDYAEAIPAFIGIVAMPLTYSISDGIMFGVISYTIINLCTGRAAKMHWLMYVLTIIFIAKYALM